MPVRPLLLQGMSGGRLDGSSQDGVQNPGPKDHHFDVGELPTWIYLDLGRHCATCGGDESEQGVKSSLGLAVDREEAERGLALLGDVVSARKILHFHKRLVGSV
ncbi:hypothetical protein RvY_18118-2 [Ramazzottius varieornatus]|uniref:Uncharacterized protein n=1 Tax=Ramazzottius varieornatus TaxID=947166 RepID=A0A1D1W838_RAMVA|nr:hypothetical protein RvY_18118-2 [Ramazzottius varieornatus]